MRIKKCHLDVIGTRPFFWHAAGIWTIPLEKQEQTGVAGNDPEEWKKTVLVNKETWQLYAKAEYVFSCFRKGAYSVKKGLQSKVASTLQVEPELIYLEDLYLPDGLNSLTDDPTANVYLDVRPVKRDKKATNIRYRVAAKTGWRLGFDILFDATLVQTDLMHACAIEGGRYAGLGDARSIGMGRYEIETWEEVPM